ncbi:MAG: phage tail family protein [Clostridia bacterium]|nr:phage tail family protein [Clostridia bacterium]
MKLTFSNEMGTLNLYGSGGHDFTICEIEGLEPCEKNRSLKTYVGEDGSFEDSSQYTSRVITISGDIKSESNFMNIFKNTARVLSKEGVLTVYRDNSLRQITVNSASITIGKRYNTYCTYVIQLTCDYPHFRDINTTFDSVFELTKMLTSATALPSVLSVRKSIGTIYNSGDLKIYPIIKISKSVDVSGANKIIIKNNTTEKEITLEKELLKDEIITIDTKNRTITSSIDGNIMSSLDFYSSLSEFWLECGNNDIEISVDGLYSDITVTAEYYNEYLEAL